MIYHPSQSIYTRIFLPCVPASLRVSHSLCLCLFSHVHLNLVSYDIRSDSQCSIRGRKVKQRYGSRCLRLEIPGYLSSSQHRERRVNRLFFQVHHACLAHKPRDLHTRRRTPGQSARAIHPIIDSFTQLLTQPYSTSACLLACWPAGLLTSLAWGHRISSRPPDNRCPMAANPHMARRPSFPARG